ncbi:hypothetical protein RSC3_02184 [Bacillus paralicheniformis]|nr:hypothetical protein RSC3_02184 [Bacillus paralicheniformis]
MQPPTGKTCVPTGVDLKNTGFGYTLSLISGKYKIIILYWLSEREVMRHNELKRSIGTISFKTLSIMLKELEADGLIIRKEFPQIPQRWSIHYLNADVLSYLCSI